MVASKENNGMPDGKCRNVFIFYENMKCEMFKDKFIKGDFIKGVSLALFFPLEPFLFRRIRL